MDATRSIPETWASNSQRNIQESQSEGGSGVGTEDIVPCPKEHFYRTTLGLDPHNAPKLLPSIQALWN